MNALINVSAKPTSKPDWLKHFFFMGKTEINKASTCCTLIPKTKSERKFIKDIKKSLKVVKPNYWISTREAACEPLDEKLYFEDGTSTEISLAPDDWEESAKEFAPSWESDVATWYEWILFIAYRIAINELTIDFVCNNSTDYTKPLKLYQEMAPSGCRKVGGFYDGLTNTRKITKLKSTYVISGPSYSDCNSTRTISKRFKYPIDYETLYPKVCSDASAIIVLRKSLIHQLDLMEIEIKNYENSQFASAKTTIDKLKKISDSVNFAENDKKIASIVTKLYEILNAIEKNNLDYNTFSYLFEIYLPEFYKLINYYSVLQETKTFTEQENDKLTKSVKKFYDYLYNQNFESSVDIETTKIHFNAIANTFINLLDK